MTSPTQTLEALRGGGAPATLTEQPSRSGRTLVQLLDDPKVQKGLAAVASNVLSPTRIAKLVTNAVYRTPALALCDPTTVLGALMASVSLGLEPNTPAGHAYLIPYKRNQPRKDANGNIVTGSDGRWLWDETYECQFQIGYRGFIVLGYRSPKVGVIDAEAVHRNDHFRFHKGSGATLEWSLKDLGAERGPLVGAYCHVVMKDGGENFTVMPLEELHKIRDRSDTYTSLKRRLADAQMAVAAARSDRDKSKAAKDLERAQKTFDETPWVLWEDGMGVKSVIKRHVNTRLPLDPGDLLRLGVDLDNHTERGAIDLSAFVDVDRARALAHGELPVDAIAHNPQDTTSEDTGEAGDTAHGTAGDAEPASVDAEPSPGTATAADAAPPAADANKPPRAGRAAKSAPPTLNLE